MVKMAPGTKEGEGTVRINFETLETLLEYKDVGAKIAKQILLVRRVLKKTNLKKMISTHMESTKKVKLSFAILISQKIQMKNV